MTSQTLSRGYLEVLALQVVVVETAKLESLQQLVELDLLLVVVTVNRAPLMQTCKLAVAVAVPAATVFLHREPQSFRRVLAVPASHQPSLASLMEAVAVAPSVRQFRVQLEQPLPVVELVA
jgi:hypothetical protein